ncbi:MAG: HrpA-like RNA helicase [Barrevirus sp.]|uniref:RNA helicase n=1 Tax=Barrevirus sp. TaxID=2487763 RepID=A0A3G4ZQX0_9VIRU|nr:MAG: HrpA-like RNA helicase [Barrevirus sp.]
MNNDYYFMTEPYKSELRSYVINQTFKSLNLDDKSILTDYLALVIDTIAIKFNFSLASRDVYEQQFRQNNYKDAVGLLYILLPFINENANKSDIKSLNDIYVAKKDNKNVDINEEAPIYKYSNLQYGRCDRDNGIATEIKFSKDHLTHNYILLLETIKTVANKLYVNWINIRPVSSNHVPQLLAFQETRKTFDSYSIGTWDPADQTSGYKLNRGLDASEIYNIISNYLFHDIFRIKWILYEVYPNPQSVGLRFLDAFTQLFNIDMAAKNIPWSQLTDDNKQILQNQWTNFISLFNNNSVYANLKSNNIQYIMKTFIIFFDRAFRHRLSRDKNINYIPLDLSQNQQKEDEDDIIETMGNLDPLKATVNSLNGHAEYIYEYSRESLLQLRSTYYSQFYLKYNEENQEYEYDPNINKLYVEGTATVKNVYNYAKSLISYKESKSSYQQLPRFWKSLTDSDKEVIISRLNHRDNETAIEWFNIMRYLTGTVGLSSDLAKLVNRDIHRDIRNNLSEILFNVLSEMGLLSEFVPDFRLTTYKYLPENTNERNKEILNRLNKYVINDISQQDRWFKSIYYLNKVSFKNIYNNFEKLGKIRYLDALTKAGIGSWITMYAMDWISQISFFHRYLNNRIIYVTGSTGVGKSTQAPKLLLYALKMLDYKSNGSIVVTQPRIPPTEKNAKRISAELGVPILEYNESTKSEIRTNNYIVQYKYKEKSHENKVTPGLTLTIMTDGTLEQQLKNPVLKRLAGSKYSSDNVYDIVCVDEAHEHGRNMDLILTRMKYVSYYNNDIKLVIISATMDQDEPIYRRYYRNVNDNRMYPVSLWLEKHSLDRINVDRRIHISPPNETTQYKITEFYRPDTVAEDLVIEIVNTTPNTGNSDILLFKSGEADIKKARDYLNANIANPSVIALPYFSKMSEDKKSFIGDISTNKRFLDIPKNVPFENPGNNYHKVSLGTYTRVIIVATNIAEASITIDTLKYVVDTGSEKINEFNYKTRSTNLIETAISESSRLQRKGRVGRTGPGTVFYTYKELDKLKNKIKYEIAIENFSEKLFEYLKSDDTNDIPFFDQHNDPNKLSSLSIDNLTNLYKFGLDRMIRKQYFTKSTFYSFVGNRNHYDYENNVRPEDYYRTGYSKETLDDKKGTFYIIHPDELCFERNILGQPIRADKTCNLKIVDHTIESEKMQVYWEMLTEYLLIVPYQNDYYKTELGTNIMALKNQMKSDISFPNLISYIYSRAYDCSDDLIKLVAMYSVCRSPKDIILTTVTTDGKRRSMMEAALDLYGNSFGDSYSLINISNLILDYFGPTKKFNDPTILENIKQKKLKFIEAVKSKNYKGLESKSLDTLLSMYNTGQLSTGTNVSIREKEAFIGNNSFLSIVLSDLTDNPTKNKGFEDYCTKQLLNYDTVISFIKTYSRLINDLSKYEMGINDLDPEINESKIGKMSWFNTHVPKMLSDRDIVKEDRIKIALLHGYPYNLVKNIAIIRDNYYYINIFRPNIRNIYSINKLYEVTYVSKKKIINNSFLRNTDMMSTILYVKQDEDEDTGDINILFIENIRANIISKVIPQMLDRPERYDVKSQEKDIKEYLRTLTSPSKNSQILNLVIKNYGQAVREIKHDLYNNYDKNVMEKLKIIDDRETVKKVITNIFRDKIYRSQEGGSNKDFDDNSFVRDIIDLLYSKNSQEKLI